MARRAVPVTPNLQVNVRVSRDLGDLRQRQFPNPKFHRNNMAGRVGRPSQCDARPHGKKKSALGAVHTLVTMRTMCILTTRRRLVKGVHAHAHTTIRLLVLAGPALAVNGNGRGCLGNLGDQQPRLRS